jgi:hypothetical protein
MNDKEKISVHYVYLLLVDLKNPTKLNLTDADFKPWTNQC